MGAKYNFTIEGSSLVIRRTPIDGDTAYKAITFKSPSLTNTLGKIRLFEAGDFQTSLRFVDFGEIDGVEPTDIENAETLLLALIETVDNNHDNSYSTTETLTGGTWIDSKPIYKKTKVFSGSELSDVGLIDITPYFSDIDTICPKSGIFTDWTTDNGIKSFGQFLQDGNSYQITPTTLAINMDMTIFDSITLSLEYTKTTD